MEKRRLGLTDLEVTRLGFGAARIADEGVAAEQVSALLNGLLDTGVNFFDTAPCYQGSEELIGATVAPRRSEYLLATKCGHAAGLDGTDWSADVIRRSVARSLRRLRTDHLDLVQLHSCSEDVLRHGEAVRALEEARDAGKTRYIGYSGDQEAALEAIRMGVFDTLQTSFSVLDQHALDKILPAAHRAGLGIIIKRPLANAAFGAPQSPYGYADEYWRRGRRFTRPEGAPAEPIELSLRFVLSFDEVDTAIAGTADPEHALANLRHAAAGPLDPGAVQNLRDQFRRLDEGWVQRT